MKVEDELKNPVQISNHPEQKSQKSKYLRLIILQFTISILMVLVTATGVFRMVLDTSNSGKIVVQQYASQTSTWPLQSLRHIDSSKWDSKPVARSFLTHGKFKDGSPIEIEYNLTVQFPVNNGRMDYLKETFGTPEKTFSFLNTYLGLITAMTTASTQEVSASFWESLRRQAIHGLDTSMGVSSADIGKSPKNYGIQLTVYSIGIPNFFEIFFKSIEKN